MCFKCVSLDYEIKMFIFILWIVSLISSSDSHCSSVYGSEPCSFLPAPPGKTPPCARPGLTYCEHPDRYPAQLIHYLLQKWRYDHSTLLLDESKEEFSSYFYPPPKPKYGPPNYQGFGPNNIIGQDGYFAEPIYIPKPEYPFNVHNQGNTYIPPKLKQSHNFTGGFNGYPNRKPTYQEPQPAGQFLTYKYSANFPQANHPPVYNEYSYNVGPPQYPNELWKRKLENKFIRQRRALRAKRSQLSKIFQRDLLKEDPFLNATATLSHERRKRQNNISGEPLCQARSQFVMPRAALNNKGNWMFVVNMPDVDSRYSQLVKSEVCVSQVCSAVCGLPAGYTSRCEQKYVQKRLVALEGGGDQLYTDLFWFPSCCVCTLSNQ